MLLVCVATAPFPWDCGWVSELVLIVNERAGSRTFGRPRYFVWILNGKSVAIGKLYGIHAIGWQHCSRVLSGLKFWLVPVGEIASLTCDSQGACVCCLSRLAAFSFTAPTLYVLHRINLPVTCRVYFRFRYLLSCRVRNHGKKREIEICSWCCTNKCKLSSPNILFSCHIRMDRCPVTE